MEKYEIMLITTATLDEEASTKLVNKFTAMIEKGGKLETVDAWGTRKLAYPINDENEGVYTLITFESEPDFPAELERVCNITDGVLRTMTTVKAESAAPAAHAAPAPAAAPKTETEAE